MQNTNDYCNKEDDSKEDICTTKFLELLLRYGYVWRLDCEEALKLNLSEKDMRQFLNECRVFLQDLTEMKAAMKLANIRELYNKELQKSLKNADESKFRWFSLADKLFRRDSKSTTKKTAILWPLKHMARSRGSMSNSQPLTQNDTSPSVQRETLTRKHTRSISSRNLAKDTGITTENLPYIPRKSKSLPSTSQSSLYVNKMMTAPTSFLCLCPPIATHNKSANLKVCNVNAAPESLVNTSTLHVASNSISLATGDSISSTPRANISPSARTPISHSAGSSIAPSARTPISPSVRTPISPSARTPISPSDFCRTSVSPSAGSPNSPFARVPFITFLRVPFPLQGSRFTSFKMRSISPLQKISAPCQEDLLHPPERKKICPL
ncbi:hypothetical protein AVEN_21710-1 [Araneus ventricosus]|uniref:Uncharacterized protein n=1 Tax=Araneus ventricosus TaxID=182803 RepID=A0A4Y2VX71_ARAVE|nr:hypothetical protein AVEN_21710-1 [Araneus ventricosus]